MSDSENSIGNDGLVVEATATVEAPKKRAGPAQLLFSAVGSADAAKAIKYPMPLKAARYHLTINGEQCEAAQTTFGEIKYTYFLFGGASFYVPGHHNPDTLYEFTYPEGYKFQPLKLDRRAQSEAAAKAKAAKALLAAPVQADAGPGEAAAASEQATEGGSSLSGSEALHEPPAAEAEAMSGKKSKRAQR